MVPDAASSSVAAAAAPRSLNEMCRSFATFLTHPVLLRRTWVGRGEEALETALTEDGQVGGPSGKSGNHPNPPRGTVVGKQRIWCPSGATIRKDEGGLPPSRFHRPDPRRDRRISAPDRRRQLVPWRSERVTKGSERDRLQADGRSTLTCSVSTSGYPGVTARPGWLSFVHLGAGSVGIGGLAASN